MKKQWITILSLIALVAACIILRFPLFQLHGMLKWPVYLFAVGIIVIAVSGFGFRRNLLPVLTAIGYIVGFCLGYVFQFDYGIGLNSLWIIWTCIYGAFIVIGIAVEVFFRKQKID